MHLILIVVAFVIAVGVAIKSHGSKKYMRSVIANIPGPHCIPILGCLYDVYKLNQKAYGRFYWEIWSRYKSADIELNEQLLISNDHITKNRNYETLRQWLGKGLLISNGKKWHARRKIITPTFHFKILEQFVDVFERQSSLVLEILKERADGKTVFDIYPFMCLLTLDIIAESAMGTKVNAQSGQAIPYTSAVREMTIMMAWRFQQLHLHNEILFSILQPFKKMRQTKLIQIMHQFTRNVIAKRREELKNNKRNTNAAYNEDNTYSEIGAKRRMALLDVLLQATVNGEPLTDEDIREEVDTFMFEGHDTTASALSFILHLLSRHPRVQNKLFNEIQQLYGDHDVVPFTLMNLNELKYMECVIKEGLRLCPPVPIIARDMMEDFKYEHSSLGPGVIPTGTEFFMLLYFMMRDPKRFENPNDFWPERHEHDLGSSFGSFVPFSAGPRNCIGQKFAMYELKVVLVKILQQYELLPLGEDVKPVPNLVLRSENGMQLGIKMRS